MRSVSQGGNADIADKIRRKMAVATTVAAAQINTSTDWPNRSKHAWIMKLRPPKYQSPTVAGITYHPDASDANAYKTVARKQEEALTTSFAIATTIIPKISPRFSRRGEYKDEVAVPHFNHDDDGHIFTCPLKNDHSMTAPNRIETIFGVLGDTFCKYTLKSPHKQLKYGPPHHIKHTKNIPVVIRIYIFR